MTGLSMSRTKYVVKMNVGDPNPELDECEQLYIHSNPFVGNITVFDSDAYEVETGLLTAKGEAIVKMVGRNPIGFHAKFED